MSTTYATRGPTRDTERSPAPDLARGFMLLLIVLANSPFYLWAATEVGLTSPHPKDGSTLDLMVDAVIITAVDFRTYPMFAFLFGYGMVQLYRRQTAGGLPEDAARRLLQRRNRWLLVFGFVHAALLWMGDILGAYGLAGLVLVALFLRRRDKTLIIWAAVLTGLLLLSAIGSVLGGVFVAGQPAAGDMAASGFGITATQAEPNYLLAMIYRLVFWAGFSTLIQGLLMLVVPVMILLAFWAGRRQILERPGEHLTLLRRTAAIGIPIGWLGALPSVLMHLGVLDIPEHASWMFSSLSTVTGMCAGVGYVALFGLIGHHVSQRRSRQPEAGTRLGFTGAVTAVGKRSLSCYLLQSVLCAPVLAAWGLGLGQYLGSATMAAYAIGVWLVTVIFAVLLERAGRRGPAEVLLRRLAYRRPLTAT